MATTLAIIIIGAWLGLALAVLVIVPAIVRAQSTGLRERWPWATDAWQDAMVEITDHWHRMLRVWGVQWVESQDASADTITVRCLGGRDVLLVPSDGVSALWPNHVDAYAWRAYRDAVTLRCDGHATEVYTALCGRHLSPLASAIEAAVMRGTDRDGVVSAIRGSL